MFQQIEARSTQNAHATQAALVRTVQYVRKAFGRCDQRLSHLLRPAVPSAHRSIQEFSPDAGPPSNKLLFAHPRVNKGVSMVEVERGAPKVHRGTERAFRGGLPNKFSLHVNMANSCVFSAD